MNRKCNSCNVVMQEALLNTNAAFCVQTKVKGRKPKLCNVNVIVCPKCGYVEMFAEQPNIFSPNAE
ncbi:MAG: hypothetical protein ACRC3H_06505 [Lachnospiraceae bacterium]